MRRGTGILFSTCLLIAASAVGSAQSKVRVSTAPQGFAAPKGTIKGRAYTDYLVKAGAGQTLSVTMSASNSATYFNILPPNSEEAIFIGSTSGLSASRRIAMTGEYTIRVYLMPSAGRRGETSNFKLNVTVRGTELKAIPASQDPVIPGTPYHAQSIVPSVVDGNASDLTAYVVRYTTAGSGTVEIVLPNKQRRQILFVDGKVAGWNSTNRATSARSGDNTVVTIGDEKYTIPDAMVYGG